MPRALAIPCAVLVAVLGCTNASVYSVAGKGANLPDRATFEGVMCVPTPAGKHFPTRILYTIQGGPAIDQTTRQAVMDAVTQGVARYSSPFVRYGLVAYDDFAFSLVPHGFSGVDDLKAALPKYGSFSEPGPLSLARALELAESLVSGILIDDCPGARARGRYTVVMLFMGPDATPDSHCDNLPDADPCYQVGARCGACLIDEQTKNLRGLMQKYGVADVSVQPVYVVMSGSPVQAARDAAAQIANLGGTVPLTTDVPSLKATLGGLNLAGLLEPMTLRTVLAFNRNAKARSGKVLPDSDGDGLVDEDEDRLGTDRTNPDSDGDGLMDGVEVLAGLNPLVIDVIKGCDLGKDEDRDGLNSCEERLVGTSDCMGDTDGDGMPDLVELFEGTDSLKSEGTLDTDRDGFCNLDEIRRHTDPTSNDLEFIGSHSYTYSWEEQEPPPPGSPAAENDPCPGRVRYLVHMGNVGLVPTLATPVHEEGANDIYLYAVFALQSGGSIARWQAQTIVFKPPVTRVPPDPVLNVDESVCENRP